MRKFGVRVVVCINRFASDTGQSTQRHCCRVMTSSRHPTQDTEIETVVKAAMGAGAFGAVPSTHHANGGAGALPLATLVKKVVLVLARC